MKNKSSLALILILTFIWFSTFPMMSVIGHSSEEPFVTELIAGGGNEKSAIDVGEIRVWNDADYLYVKYVIDTDLTPDNPSDDGVPTLIYESHLHIEEHFMSIPQKNGNPIPGQFNYKTEHDPGVSEFTYEIPITWDIDTQVSIAAHALVQKIGGLDGLELALPDQVTMSVIYPYGGGPAYFPHTYISGGTNLDGDYLGWCIDTDNVIYQNTQYQADIYSSYENLPEGLVEYPENLDLVNWIINQEYVGQQSPGCSGIYTYGDVQRAIWELIEDVPSTSGLEAWSQCRVNEILATAYINGEGFEPDCGDVIAIILAPFNNQQTPMQTVIAQVTLIDVNVPCDTIDETAWGAGFDFPGKNWATYFTYVIQPHEELWPTEGTATIAFEDLPIDEGNDYDYNDFIVDISILGHYSYLGLYELEMTFEAQARGAAYHHELHLNFSANTFESGGSYLIEYYETDGSFISSTSNSFDNTFDLDTIIFYDTWLALPSNWEGWAGNTFNGSGIQDGRITTVSIIFDTPVSLDLSSYTPEYVNVHGTNLFFDPYLYVDDTGQEIHIGDQRLIVVPSDWEWPREQMPIWNVYPYNIISNEGVTSGNPPTFTTYWYTETPTEQKWMPFV